MRIEPNLMNLTTLPRPTASASTSEQRSFSQIMATGNRSRVKDDEDPAQEAAESLVAVTLIEPILREARESRSAEPPFGLTEAEKQFGALMDARTAERIVQSWDMPLVDRLARQMREHTRNVETSRHERSRTD